jgi:iron complex outermembrane recepter protein
VLKDGASAIYGSDAIGGVVDFTLKTDFEGAVINFDYGVSSEDDGERKGTSAAFGVAGERGNFMVNLNYSDQEQVSAADRDFSRDALSITSGVVSVGGSSRTTTGRYLVPTSLATSRGINVTGCPTGRYGTDAQGNAIPGVALTRNASAAGTSVSDFRCFASSDLFNYQAVGNLELTPQERAGIFFAGNFNITDNVKAYAEAWSQNTSSAFQIAPLPFDGRPGQDEVVLSATNIFNPFGVDIRDSRLRLSRIGNRRSEFDTQSQQINAGVSGTFGETSWDWDAGVTYGKLTQDATRTGYLLTSALTTALGPSFRDATGTPRCGTVSSPIAGCIPVDFFGSPPDANTAAGRAQLAALNSIATTTTDSTIKTLKSFQANFRGDAFETSAGTAGVALGLEYRKDYLSADPDFLARLNPSFTCLISSEACATATRGETKVKEVFGEILVPILADAPFAKTLNLTGGVRFSDYDSFGNTTNAKIGFEWKPMDDLLVRGTYAQVFRAPTITDLFGGQTAASDSYSDPCTLYGSAGNPRSARGDVACRGVPTNGTFRASDTQLSAIFGGNANTKAEEGTVVTYGFVYSPVFLPGASATLDFWRVSLENTIGAFGTQPILNACFNTGAFCDRYTRGTDGEVLRLFNPTDNVGETDTNGVDIGTRYNFDTDSFGSFRVNIDSTYLDKYDTKILLNGVQVGSTRQNAGTFLGSNKGGDGNYSRWRSLGNLTWNMGDFEAALTSRYIHRFVVGSDRPGGQGCGDNAGAPGINGDGVPFSCRLKRGAYTYHNVSFAYNAEPLNTKFRLGVDNLFDKQPPIIYQNNSLNGNTDERTYDTVGRYFWLTSSTKF